MKKLTLIIVLLLIVENILIWYSANFYYQYQTYEKITDSKAGQAKVCEKIPLFTSLYSVLETMKNYSGNAHVGSNGKLTLYYGSEAKGFISTVGVGFDFDKNYKLTHKSCGSGWEPEDPIYNIERK